jgi:2-succinyl-5-enolpyruvyl-6-hydroxy-3-cyclohexene-1-carboxylate synthase
VSDRTTDAPSTAGGAVRAFAEELSRSGVAEAIICPGSRSTPLALALHAHSAIRCRVLLDERAAGFFALGLARATCRPVAVLCTSGTAAVNLAPAVVEAFYGRVPLVVLTADRPPELRDRGSAQTIDQLRLFGTQVKWFAEVSSTEATGDVLAHVRSLAGRAAAIALSAPRGPVHLNFPLREPLIPAGPLGPLDGRPGDGAPFTNVVDGVAAVALAELEALAARLATIERGLIVAGPQDDPALAAPLARLAAATGYPILADALSQVRVGPHDRSRVVARADLIVRPGPWIDAHRPEIAIRFGAMPTSKPILELLRDAGPAQMVVDGGGGWREAALLPSTFVHADEATFADGLAGAIGRGALGAAGTDRSSSWTEDWLAADRAAAEAIDDWLAEPRIAAEQFEPRPFTFLADLLPDGAILWAGNSMPVRDMDTYLPAGPRAIRCFANRGVSGIDGVVSSALGAAADGAPLVLVVGDLSFLHDLNALTAARLHGLSATIVLTNNDGGGIFSFLPQASTNDPGVGLPDAFEELFGTPHGTDFGPIATALGAGYRLVGPADLRAAVTQSIGAPGVQVLEVRTERARNVALHREAAALVARALDALAAAGAMP